MSTTPSQVILFGYDFSTFSQKISQVLTVKKIPFKVVHVSDRPPRPELECLGITYRRIPLLSIDGDVFIDSSLIVEELEKRFTVEDGYETLWPGESKALAPMFYGLTRFWSDKPIFDLCAALLPLSVWKDAAFKKDREKFRGETIDEEELAKGIPDSVSQFESHLIELEEQLTSISSIHQDEIGFILGTDKITYTDIGFYFVLNYMRDLYKDEKESDIYEIFNPSSDSTSASFPKLLLWMELMDSTLASPKRESPYFDNESVLGGEKIFAELARVIIQDGKRRDVEIDESEALIRNGKLRKGDTVELVPEGNGSNPQVGTLIGLTRKKGCLEIKTTEEKSIHLHFPRLGYKLIIKP